MKRYDYYESVTADILKYVDKEINFADYEDLDELANHLYDTLLTESPVTGNYLDGHGYYTTPAKASEYLRHNRELLEQALYDYCTTVEEALKYPDECDMIIRCALLSKCIDRAMRIIGTDFFNA